MFDYALLASIATQLMSGTQVTFNGKILPVRRTSSQRLKAVAFEMNGSKYPIEQNPDKPSRWGTARPRGPSGCAIQGRRYQPLRRCFD